MAKDWIAFGSVRAFIIPGGISWNLVNASLSWTTHSFGSQWVGWKYSYTVYLDSARNPKGSAFQGRQVSGLQTPEDQEKVPPNPEEKQDI